MKAFRIGVATPGIAALVALTVTLASTTTPASTAAAAQVKRSSQAAAAETAMTRTNLSGKLEAELGESFSGVWFEPSTALLHVGVTSPSSRRAAESVAAGVGLASILAETGVKSTWGELEAAQDRWDRKLAGLIEGGEAATSLAPELNAVEVELSSAVPPDRRAELERDAANAGVKIAVRAAPYRDLGAKRLARCKAFAVGEAFCDPGLVGGVTFDGEIIGGEEESVSCTTGPAVISKKATEPTQTYVLTAGHCVAAAGGNGSKWFAYNKEGAPKGKHEVGKAVAFVNAETDVGVVEVAGYWTLEGLIPLFPTIAPWDQAAPQPFPVVAERVPVKNSKACMSGQMSGIECGEIVKTNQTIEVEGVEFKNLIEVNGVSGIEGDSGGPWFAEAEFKANPPTGYVEGTTVGEKGETGNVVFQSLAVSLPALKNKTGWELELLTGANMLRHAKNWFHSEIERTFLFGEQATENVFTTPAGKVKCKKASFSGEATGAEKAASDFTTSSIELTPSYSECTAFGQAATVTTTGCKYRLTASGETTGKVVVDCEAGKAITINVPSGNCLLTVGTQTPGENSVEYKSEGTGSSRVNRVTSKVGKIAYTVTGPGTICGTAGAHTDGTYTGTLLEKGYKNAGHTEQVGIWVK